MTRTRSPRPIGRRPRDERGTALMLALMFVGSIAFVIGATLEFAYSAIQQGVDTRTARSARYASEGVIDTIAAKMRADTTGLYGRYGQPCASVSLVISGVTYTGVCVPDVTSGALNDAGARGDRVVDVTVSDTSGNAYAHARISAKDGAGYSYGQWVTIREWSSDQ